MLNRSEKFKYLEERQLRIKFSLPIKQGELDRAYTLGMLPKLDLEDGVYYQGYCRHATVAMWSAEKSCFIYMRQKFGRRYPDEVNHPEDDNGFDLFVPLRKIVPREDEIIYKESQQGG
jgi:hypothetical protein